MPPAEENMAETELGAGDWSVDELDEPELNQDENRPAEESSEFDA